MTGYFNGVVYTADDTRPVTSAFVVNDGIFEKVGDDSVTEGCTELVDLKGHCVIPGLIDSHCHMFAGITSAAMDMIMVDPGTAPDELGEVLAGLMEGREKEADKTVAAMGIDLTKGEFSAKNIDCAISDRAAVVFSEDGHALLLNSRAMEQLGIDEHTEDPGDNSYFARDDQGKPTGLVIEIPAMMQCKKLIQGHDMDVSKVLLQLCGAYASYGYTTIFEAMSSDDPDVSVYESLSELDEKGKLGLRICTSFGYHGEDVLSAEDVIEIMKGIRENFSSSNVYPDTLKIITDGTVEEHTALLYEPYTDQPENSGSEMIPHDDMKKAAGLAADAGFNIHIHAIGDRAVGRALDVLRGLGEIKGTKTIAHNQLYGTDELQKMTQAGDIFFQTTPHWVVSDDYTRNCIGEKRYLRQFPIGTMEKSGVTVSFGSDSCLEEKTADPFLGMYYAEARGIREYEGECYPPLSEGIAREAALKAYTINGARQLGLESVTGSITEGKSADFVITDRDIMKCPLKELKEAEAEETYFRGKKVFTI